MQHFHLSIAGDTVYNAGPSSPAIPGQAMSHAISTFIARQPAIAALSTALGNAAFVSRSEDDLCFLPVTDDVFDQATTLKGDSDPVAEKYYRLSKALAEIAQVSSASGPIIHVFTDYFGGDGSQGAMAWNNGAVTLKPEVSRLGPINTALRSLGVEARPSMDAFDTIGLGRLRSNDSIEALAPKPQPPAAPQSWGERLSHWFRKKS